MNTGRISNEKKRRAGKDNRLAALITLMQDENVRVASLAMEELLKLDGHAEWAVAEFQDAQDEQLRLRIHQLGCVLTRRRNRRKFVEAVKAERLPLWRGVLALNRLYDPRFNAEKVRRAVSELRHQLQEKQVTTPRVAAFMRDEEFLVPEEDYLDTQLFMIQSVLELRFGCPAILCALAQHISTQAGWGFTTVLYAGRFCLIDRNNLLLDPSEGWRISKLKEADKIHPCARKDILYGMLSQLFLVALMEGHLRDLYHFGDLLTALNGATIQSLPYPLGELKPNHDS